MERFFVSSCRTHVSLSCVCGAKLSHHEHNIMNYEAIKKQVLIMYERRQNKVEKSK